MKLASLTARTVSFNHDRSEKLPSSSAIRIARPSAPPSAGAAAPRLTPRELEVLALLCEGMPNKLISRELNISSGTVKIHVGKILSALSVSSRLQAVVVAHRLGLLNGSMMPACSEADALETRALPRVACDRTTLRAA